MDTGLIRDIVVSVSSVVVAVAAITGFFQWRKEMTGRVKFELAKNIMLLALKLEDNFTWARHPLTSSWEASEREHRDGESKEEASMLDLWYIRRMRMKPLVENLQKLQELGYEAEVVFDKKTGDIVTEGIKCYKQSWADVDVSIDSYFIARRDEIKKKRPDKDQEYLLNLQKTFSGYGKDDKITINISQAKQKLVDTLKRFAK